MLNRTLQVKMVKVGKDDVVVDSTTDTTTFEGKVAIVGRQLERVVEKAASAVVTYVVIDTIRQIMVARANRS